MFWIGLLLILISIILFFVVHKKATQIHEINTETDKINKEIEKGAKVILMVPFLQTDNFGSYTAGYYVAFEKESEE